ncbi:MAG: SAM-dependent methyltransferase [Pseudonocardiales bacterium]|nr:SAM-dependent methyltransferase [Pseudonocardiales bacterium]
MRRSFEDLLAEAEAAEVAGWDFDWLDGRATEQRPTWGYQRLLSDRLGDVSAALDIQTGGGEVLAGVPRFPPLMVATESWPPNLARARAALAPRGVAVVADRDAPPLPFATGSFDLVTSRHPVSIWWSEIARVLRPGGRYLAQHIGPRSNAELYEYFLGPSPASAYNRQPDAESAGAQAAGLDVIDLRTEGLRIEFRDIGAVVYFLRKVIWTVPDFTVARYRTHLRDLHQQIEADGTFVCHSTRTLIEATKPAAGPALPAAPSGFR